MSSSSSTQQELNPPPTIPTRYITTHDPKTGKAVLDKTLDTKVQPLTAFPGLYLYNIYTTTTHPATLTADADLLSFPSNPLKFADLDTLTGSQYQIVEIHPDNGQQESVMHRTVSLDIGLILDGEVELSLDSGETKRLKRGDIVVQRGTMHAWRNLSATEPARIFFALTPIEKVVLGEGGRELEFEYPGLSDKKE